MAGVAEKCFTVVRCLYYIFYPPLAKKLWVERQRAKIKEFFGPHLLDQVLHNPVTPEFVSGI